MAIHNDLMELVNGCDVAEKADTAKVPAATETADLLSELGFKAAAANINKRLRPILKKAEIAAGGYIEITPAKIQDFLNRKAAEYNKLRPAKSKMLHGAYSALGGDLDYVSRYLDLVQNLGTQISNQYHQSITTSTTTSTQAWVDNMNGQFFGGGIQELAQAVRPNEYFTAATEDATSRAPGTVGRFNWTEVPVDIYTGIPPMNVLQKFKETVAKKVFDYFTVASVNAVHDPLLLGRVNECSSRFFVGQWGDDVSLDDVI